MKAGIYRTPNGNLIYVAKDRTIKATNLAPSSWPGTKVSHRAKDDTVLIAGTDYRCTRWADVPNGCTDPAKALADAKEANDAEIKEALGLPADLKPGQDLAEWALGREHKPFSKQIVYGHGPGFLTEQAAAAERWLVQNTAQLDALVESGVLSRLHDEYTVLDAERYAAYLASHENGSLAASMGEAIRGTSATLRGVTAATKSATKAAQQFGRDFTEQQDRMRALGYRRCHKQSARKHRRAGHSVITAGDGSFWWIKAA